ncbi:type II toxin-antitoxin system VapB family antitoxin [Glycomyces tenuis]|uniref:type II toxin-antitoxin system VapB family antitoxin n=1 Tax=Glycomyces tenuis TaxID=58116 RepID=UPI00047E592F|nr:type II toxin-antitoxin system VapB family antitoxin [Glycomyces tenuis]
MTRTVINLDDELVAQASEIFGTTTKVATVNAALKEAVDRERRRQFVEWVVEGGLELDPDEIREIAW